MSHEPILVADCVAKRYGTREVLTAASLRAVPGQVRILLGRNGCGKTTLLRITTGLLQPDSGVVHYAGRAQLRISLAMLARRGVFFLPDHPMLHPALTLRAQSRIMHSLGGLAGIRCGEESASPGLMDLCGNDLSPGESKRAGLALALGRRPLCLLADEPFRGVTPKDAGEYGAALRQLASEGCAIVLSGHEVPVLLDIADHVTWCTSGTTYELGPPERPGTTGNSEPSISVPAPLSGARQEGDL